MDTLTAVEHQAIRENLLTLATHLENTVSRFDHGNFEYATGLGQDCGTCRVRIRFPLHMHAGNVSMLVFEWRFNSGQLPLVTTLYVMQTHHLLGPSRILWQSMWIDDVNQELHATDQDVATIGLDWLRQHVVAMPKEGLMWQQCNEVLDDAQVMKQAMRGVKAMLRNNSGVNGRRLLLSQDETG